MQKSLITKVDAVMLRVPSLDEGLAFYRDRLGHQLIWRSDTAAGLAMSESNAELVIATDLGPETDLMVDSVEAAVEEFVAAGGRVRVEPKDIPIGRLAVVLDPFGNELVLLDSSKGHFTTDEAGHVTGVISS
jgi:catechol 2,3-dioxygenase-like lactoylglutathione lyase family enzyme